MFESELKYQESRMASDEEFTQELDVYGLEENDVFTHGGPVLFRNGPRIYVDSSDVHSLILGDTGSMKTLRFVLPLIYTCAKAGESMVIVDPKGEIARKMTPHLEKKGYKNVVLNYRNPQRSPDMWNPMGQIEEQYSLDKEGKQMATMQLNNLLNDIFFKRTHVKDPYWNESAGQWALGISLLILALGEELTIKNLLKWRYEKLSDGTLQKCFDSLAKESEIYQNLAGYMELTAENTKSCIRSTFDQLVRVFKSSPALTDMLSSTSFKMDEIGKEKTAVFLIVPDENTTFHFLVTLFIGQCYSSLLNLVEDNEGILPVRVNFVLEEFCNLPTLEDLLPMITAARSRNIRMHLVIQSYGQMVEKYGENTAKAVLDNCGNLIYLHSREIQFLKYISELAGHNEYGRPLVSISRLQRLRKNETLIFHDRCYPMLAADIPLIFEYPITLGSSIPEKTFEQEEISLIDDEFDDEEWT
ncbi:MAG TPA: hypothetical protein DCM49_04390 [Lachnospiraceae bacterium]|nr:hypothetical protein [Lachnospiraceae bacterium]